MIDLPALRLLVQGYLNLDWPDDYGDPWRAVDDFLQNEPSHVGLLLDEIENLLRDASEEALRRLILEDLGSGYLPETEGWAYRSWLTELARRTSKALSGIGP